MGGILDTIFGAKSKDKSSSTTSSTSHSGNYAFPYLADSLAPATKYLSQGGDMLGALLGIKNPGNPGATPSNPNPVNPTPTAPAPFDYNNYTNPADIAAPFGYNPESGLGRSFDMRRAEDGPNYADYSPIAQQQAQQAQSQPIQTASDSSPVGSANPQEDALNTWANSAGMNFLRDQGAKAIDASRAGKGILQSGGTGVALEKLGQGLAQTYLNQYMSQLLDYSKLGTTAAGVLAGAGDYSDGMSSGSSSGKGTGGKTGLLQTVLGNPSAFGGGQ